MPAIIDLHIANNLEDLKRVAYPEKLGKNPKALEKAIKNLYREIFWETSDQEKCYIYCLRYLLSIETLCRIADATFVRLLYAHEISRVTSKLEELKPVLEKRYQEERLRQLKGSETNLHKENFLENTNPDLDIQDHLFPTEFVSVKELFQAIQDNINILVVDVRPAIEFMKSKIKFENVINIPEDIIVAGLSANVLGRLLQSDTQNIWDKRDSFEALVFLDWNSGSDNITCTKLKYLKDSVTEWDCLRKYKQPPVIVNGGFKEFVDSYPGSVTNAHVNFIRNNEDIDELLELENISYPEPDQNISIMPLKQFTIEELEQSTRIDEQLDNHVESVVDQINNVHSLIFSKDTTINNKNFWTNGGGASINKPLDCSEDKIKNKVEEQRLKLLMEARNKKNETIYEEGKEKIVHENVGDRASVQIKNVPPPVRRETKPKKTEHIFGGWCGLVNIKNTCYMNAVLQCLKCIPIIRSICYSNYSKYITRCPPQVINEFASVIRTLSEGTEVDKKVFRPSTFYDTVCRLDSIYKKGNHEDCMEFFLFLFNYLNDDCSFDIKKKSVMIEREKAWYSHLQGRTSFWVDLFYHQFKCTKVCRACHAKADSYETDNTLMLSIPYRPSLRSVHLRDLIAEYLEDNQILDYKCSKCQNLGVITKKEVVVDPEILVLVLKRYYQDEYQETRKNNICVDFDFKFTFGNSSYRLYSVAEHRGTMEHGHYYAHGVLNDSTWVEFNDERTVKYMGDWENIRGSACAFFYCKENKNNT